MLPSGGVALHAEPRLADDDLVDSLCAAVEHVQASARVARVKNTADGWGAKGRGGIRLALAATRLRHPKNCRLHAESSIGPACCCADAEPTVAQPARIGTAGRDQAF